MAKADQPPHDSAASPWGSFYKLAAASALIIAALYLVEIVIVGATGPPPTTVLGYFNLIESNRALGILKLFVLDIIATAFLIPLFLALYNALKKVSPGYTALAAAIGLIGTAAYFSTNTALTMLNLSDQYAAANETQKAIYLAMGQPLLYTVQSTGSYIALLFIALAEIIASAVMLRSKIFSKATATVGIVGNVLSLLPGPPTEIWSFPTSWFNAFVALVAVSGILLVIWYILAAKTLLNIAKTPNSQA